jgi:hypothetical protein
MLKDSCLDFRYKHGVGVPSVSRELQVRMTILLKRIERLGRCSSTVAHRVMTSHLMFFANHVPTGSTQGLYLRAVVSSRGADERLMRICFGKLHGVVAMW